LGFALNFNLCKCAIWTRILHKGVNHLRVCPMLYAMPYVHLSTAHSNRTKYSILDLKLTRA